MFKKSACYDVGPVAKYEDASINSLIKHLDSLNSTTLPKGARKR